MKNSFYIIAASVAFLILTSCRNELSEVEYIKFVKSDDSGLHKKKIVGDFWFELQFKPHDYIVLEENNGKTPSQSIYDQTIKELGDLDYYRLDIGVNKQGADILKFGINSPEEYVQRQHYFAFELKNEIQLEADGKEISCVLYHFERNYGLANKKTVMLAFPKTESNDKTIVINSSILGVGKVKISIQGANNVLELNKPFKS